MEIILDSFQGYEDLLISDQEFIELESIAHDTAMQQKEPKRKQKNAEVIEEFPYLHVLPPNFLLNLNNNVINPNKISAAQSFIVTSFLRPYAPSDYYPYADKD